MSLLQRDARTHTGWPKQAATTFWHVLASIDIQRDPFDRALLPGHHPQRGREFIFECAPDPINVESIRRDQVDRLQEI